MISRIQSARNQFFIYLVIILVPGIFLRTFQLSDQIITGDEWHALHIAMQASYAEIAGSFGDADHSIPVALYFKALMDSVGLQQWMIQLPFVASGCLLILTIPLLLRREIGELPSFFTAGLIAISPILVTEARFARPYPIAMLLSFTAVMFFLRWWRHRRRHDALIYSVCAALTGYFLILNLPFVLAPFIYFLGVILVRARRSGITVSLKTDLADLIKLGCLTAVLLAILIFPPLLNDFSALSGKSGAGSMAWQSFLRLLPVFSGNAGLLCSAAIVMLVALGIYSAWSKRIEVIGYLAVLTSLHCLAVYVANPVGTENIVVLARYLILAFPLFAALAALGLHFLLHDCWRRVSQSTAYSVAGITLIVLLIAGPVPKSFYVPNNNIVLMTISEIVLGDQLYSAMLSPPISRFYANLEERPDNSLLLVQAPYYYNFDYFPTYQHLTRQRIAMGFTEGLCSRSRPGEIPERLKDRVHLSNYFYLANPDSLTRADVDYVVFHINLEDELEIPIIVDEIDLDPCLDAYREWFGPAVFEDDKIVAFAIKST